MTQEEERYTGMSLDDFIAEPDTVDFMFINTRRFQQYVADKPYIKTGTLMEAGTFVVAYTKQQYLSQISLDLGLDYVNIEPQLLSLLGEDVLIASHIIDVKQQPFLNLTGRGVILGFIDTGIDYTKPAFRYEDGTSKIKYIWDQTLKGTPPDNIRYGAVFTQEMINQALTSQDPLSIVPSVDHNGHGTFLASVAGSREKGTYIGAAPDAEIIAVKLRPANKFYKNQFKMSEIDDLYESTDFSLGMKFIFDRAGELNRPVVICIGMGSNLGGHNGNTALEVYISMVTRRVGIICVAAAGNESNMKHHTEGVIEKSGDINQISVSVGENVSTISMYIWYEAYDKISVEVISPLNETTSRIPLRYSASYSDQFTLEKSTVSVSYFTNSSNVAVVAIDLPTNGIWNIKLYGDSILSGKYHAWMPITGVSNPGVEFLNPSPNSTITVPATAQNVICCGAYNSIEQSLYISSSWGPTTEPKIAPDFVAPGVNVNGIYPTGYGTMTGSSAAAAVTSGACALLLQWGLVDGNEPALDLNRMRALLISGCNRDVDMTYPNEQWGYGKLNLYRV
ncbi:MAG: S8 family peptidase, partial [Lachnoclostridium sp.]|nr:S8 family peptidase [Lachnoclostridium sp.]